VKKVGLQKKLHEKANQGRVPLVCSPINNRENGGSVFFSLNPYVSISVLQNCVFDVKAKYFFKNSWLKRQTSIPAEKSILKNG
jgi:hypothetical protein